MCNGEMVRYVSSDRGHPRHCLTALSRTDGARLGDASLWRSHMKRVAPQNRAIVSWLYKPYRKVC